MKKIFSVILTTALIFLLSFCCASADNTFVRFSPGDIDLDGAVTAYDARLALRLSVGLSVAPGNVALLADCGGDGKVTSEDARLILRCSIGLENRALFPPVSIPAKTKKENIIVDSDAEVVLGESFVIGSDYIIPGFLDGGFSSSDESVATVSRDGVVTPLKKGFTAICFRAGEIRYYWFVNVITEVQSRIYSLKNKYPHGYYWNKLEKCEEYPEVSLYPCPGHPYDYSTCIGQCAGFAYLMFDEVWGSGCGVRYGITKDEIRIGDYVRCAPGHSVFVIDRINRGDTTGFDIDKGENIKASEDYLIIAECNWDCKCGISWGRKIKLDSLNMISGYSFTVNG